MHCPIKGLYIKGCKSDMKGDTNAQLIVRDELFRKK